MEIPPKTIHDWRVRGVLVDEIKTAFYKIPEYARGAYFPWFLQNQHIVTLAGQPLSAKELQDYGDAGLVRTWRFTGGSERDSVGEIRAAIARKPVEEEQCYLMYALLLSQSTPSPGLDIWINFGFASCTSQGEEGVLGIQYQRLITLCTFKEFCDAYRNRRLLNLFHSKGLQVNENDQLRDLLSGHLPVRWRKSVWDLKAFVIQENSASAESSMPPSVTMDYGFVNCMNASERQQLKNVYKDFFDNHHGDPLALHEAAIKGNLYGFLLNKVQGLADAKFRQLMKNPYPLPGLESLDTPGGSVSFTWQVPAVVLGVLIMLLIWIVLSIL